LLNGLSKTSTAGKPTSASTAPYEVGYGKPPVHGQFRKGQSGNPGGRKPQPPEAAAAAEGAERAKALVLQEAYRAITVEDGDATVALPAIQAILRSQIALATKGNGPAQRAVIAAVRGIEQEQAAAAAAAAMKKAAEGPLNYTEAARRISFLLRLAEEEQKQVAATAAAEGEAADADGSTADRRPTAANPALASPAQAGHVGTGAWGRP
jgi:hypothetical protein